jgi:sigma-B regulation protein RsbU (phosphoserine phosphatase)
MPIFPRGIALKLVLAIISGTFVVGSLIFYFNNRETKKMIARHARENARFAAQSAIFSIQKSLARIEAAATTTAMDIETSGVNTARIVNYQKNLLNSQAEIYGVTVALDPGQNNGERFAPYYFKSGSSLKRVDLATDTYNYPAKEWYRTPFTTAKAGWSKPYFDHGGGEIAMATFSVPIFRQVAGERRVIGIVTADASLEWFERIVTPLAIFKSGYGFLLAEDGTYMSHPLKERILRKTIFQIAHQEPDLMEIGKRMIAGEEGFLVHESTYSHNRSFVYFMPVGSHGWSIGIACPEQELYDEMTRINRIHLIIALIGFTVLLIMIVAMSLSFTRPLSVLAQAAQQLGSGNFESALPEHKGQDEVATLIWAFNAMRRELKQYVRNLMETTAAKEKIESELDIARKIQLETLPKHPPPLSGFDLFAIMLPAERVGGDLYDFFLSKNHKLFFILGDVSGKGISAALFMATTRVLLKTEMIQLGDPAAALNELNRKLCQDNSACMFVTLLVGMLDTQTGRLTLANAGHDLPLFKEADGTVLSLETERQIACGIDPDALYRNVSLDFPKGATLMLFTDGVTEAQNEAGQFFSRDRLIQFVRQASSHTSENLGEQLLTEIKEFAGEASQTDDIALLVIHNQEQVDHKLKEETLHLPNEISQLERLSTFIDNFFADHSLPSNILYAIQLALDELFTNVCKYAYTDASGQHTVAITLRLEPDSIEWTIEDQGVHFDPLQHTEPPPLVSLEDAALGGQGIHLVKSFMDELHYVRLDNRNRTTGKKHLSPGVPADSF